MLTRLLCLAGAGRARSRLLERHLLAWALRIALDTDGSGAGMYNILKVSKTDPRAKALRGRGGDGVWAGGRGVGGGEQGGWLVLPPPPPPPYCEHTPPWGGRAWECWLKALPVVGAPAMTGQRATSTDQGGPRDEGRVWVETRAGVRAERGRTRRVKLRDVASRVTRRGRCSPGVWGFVQARASARRARTLAGSTEAAATDTGLRSPARRSGAAVVRRSESTLRTSVASAARQRPVPFRCGRTALRMASVDHGTAAHPGRRSIRLTADADRTSWAVLMCFCSCPACRSAERFDP
jgi:hypothetical protein